MEHAICYVSTASKEFSNDELRKLFETCKENNSDLDIKGILLFSEGNFFQVLEGQKENVLEIYSRILNDHRHTNIIQVMGKDVDKGSLNGFVTDHITERNFSRPELIESYCESVKGMDSDVKIQIKQILETFIDTRVL